MCLVIKVGTLLIYSLTYYSEKTLVAMKIQQNYVGYWDKASLVNT